MLRPLLADDEAAVVRYCGDEALSRYTLNIPHPYPPEGARDWLVSGWRKAALGLGWSWAMTLPLGEEVAPLVGVISLHWNGELAWWVGVPWQNQGLATRAAQRVKSFAFDTLQLPALTARHMPGNLASGRVMAKLGMHYRGLRGRTAQQPCEVSYWRLDRAISLSEPVTRQLAPWLADERVAVAILQGADAQTGLDHGRSWQLTLFLDEQGYDPDSPGGASDDGAWLDVICYPLSELDLAEPERLPLLGGVCCSRTGMSRGLPACCNWPACGIRGPSCSPARSGSSGSAGLARWRDAPACPRPGPVPGTRWQGVIASSGYWWSCQPSSMSWPGIGTRGPSWRWHGLSERMPGCLRPTARPLTP
ncbi:GNAT family N-acetyltransferase [Aeromonas hydrophila]|nr:GNAT family N-acetyltransferase [Aeromonas hydrophila]